MLASGSPRSTNDRHNSADLADVYTRDPKNVMEFPPGAAALKPRERRELADTLNAAQSAVHQLLETIPT